MGQEQAPVERRMREGVIPRCAEGGFGLPELTWSVHLARRRPGRLAGAMVVIALGAAAAGVGFSSMVLAVLAAVLLVASVTDYLFPVHYRLDGDGIGARGLWHRRYMKWSQVRRAIRDELGVKLSPLPRPSRLEAYRGIYAWFTDHNRDEVMAAIAWYTSPEAAGGGDWPPVEFVARSPGA